MALLDPANYDQTPVVELLRAASRGSIGVDRPLLRSILDRGPSAAADALAFSKEPVEEQRVDLTPLLVDLFRHFQTPEALQFLIEAIRENPDDVPDDIVQALLPYGDQAKEPLLKLYEDLGEEQGSDVAFLMAGLRLRDPRVLAILLDRLEYDAADGAFALGLYGDAAARPALEKMLAEIPADEVELRREVQYAIEQLEAPEPQYQPEPFDIFGEYPARELPNFDLLGEAEKLELLRSSDPKVRAGAAHSFFNAEVNPAARAVLLELARTDADDAVRGRAWEALADATEIAAMRDEMLAVLSDASKPVVERGGAAVGLYAVADDAKIRTALEALYAEGGEGQLKAMEAMWRSLYPPYGKFFAPHLDAKDPKLVRQALRGAGYFQLGAHADKIASYFDRDDEFEDLREDALFAYAMAVPGETKRSTIQRLLRKIDALATLTPDESELVMFALDERLRLKGLDPVFTEEHEHDENCDHEHDHGHHHHDHGPQPVPVSNGAAKVGRNDPCPCGSGKKYKKCHGA